MRSLYNLIVIAVKMENKPIESRQVEQIERVKVIDGIEFKPPKTWADYIAIGVVGAGLIIILPIWILPYLLGKMFNSMARTKEIKRIYKQKLCPACDSVLVASGDTIKCSNPNCDYYKWDYY